MQHLAFSFCSRKSITLSITVFLLFFASYCGKHTTDNPVSHRIDPNLISEVNMESATERTTGNSEKVCIIGVDALTWDILNPMLNNGELPNFKYLINRGSTGILKSFEHDCYSPRIWTTIATGMMPEKHGINFFLVNPKPGQSEMQTAGSDYRKCLAIWNILSHFKKRVLVVGWMVSWPCETINGEMISDFMEFERGTYPSKLQETYFPLFNQRKEWFEKGKRLFFRWMDDATIETPSFISKGRMQKIQNMLDIFRRDSVNLHIVNDLLNKRQYQLVMIYFRGVDIASHFYWKYSQLDPKDPRLSNEESDLERYRNAIPEYYRWVDNAIGKILAELPDGTTVFIVSDHGFMTSINELKLFNLNDLLEQLGYRNCPLSDNSGRVNLLEDQSDPIDHCRRLYWNSRAAQLLDKIEEKETIIERLETELSTVVDQNGKQIFTITGADNCPVADGDPEPILRIQIDENVSSTSHMYMNGSEISMDLMATYLDQSGNHHPEGVIIVSGGVASQGKKIIDAHVEDITPTILPIFDLPVARNMDGKVLTEVYNDSFLKNNTLSSIDTYEGKIARGEPETQVQLRPQIEEQLRVIGYIK